METTNPGRRRRGAAGAFQLFTSLLFLAAGCAQQAGDPGHDVLAQAARVSGTTGLIRFETAGGPVDVGGEVGPRLTRADAVRLALANDPDLQVALAKVRAAEADARQERLLPN